MQRRCTNFWEESSRGIRIWAPVSAQISSKQSSAVQWKVLVNILSTPWNPVQSSSLCRVDFPVTTHYSSERFKRLKTNFEKPVRASLWRMHLGARQIILKPFYHWNYFRIIAMPMRKANGGVVGKMQSEEAVATKMRQQRSGNRGS